MLIVILTITAIIPITLLSGASSSGPVTVWTEDFEGLPTAGATFSTAQNAAPITSGSDGQETAWNLVDTSSATNVLTWDGSYSGSHYYYVGIDPGAKEVSGLAYTDNADTSFIISNETVPNTLGYTTATLSFAIAGASENSFDFLYVDVKDDSAATWPATHVATFTGQSDQHWTVVNIDVTSHMGNNIDIRFHFTSDSITLDTQQDPGWCIDQVQLVESGMVTAPSAPTLSVAKTAGSYINLSWNAPADGGSPITGYAIYRGTASGSEAFLSTSSAGTHYYNDTTVTSGTTYYYNVTANNSIGPSPSSNEVSAIASDPTVPGTPTGLAATASGSAIALNWTAPSNGGSAFTAYNIYRSTSSGTEGFYAAVGNVLTYTDSAVTAGTTYYYKVSANNSIGEGARSTEASATAASTPSFTNYPGPAAADNSGEPTLGVNWNTGNVMMMTGGFPPLNIPPSQHVSRITFNDSASPATATWTDVTPAFMTGNLDPILNTDPGTGLTLAGGDDGACTILARTNDDGQTWLPVGNSCAVTVDHPTVGHSVPVTPVPSIYPNLTYVCQQESVDACAVSRDGGATFLPSAPVTCGYANPGIFGHLRSGPTGIAYIPINDCGSGGQQGVSITKDDGLTWNAGGATGISQQSSNNQDPSVATGRGDLFSGGRVYFAAKDGSNLPFVTTSTDNGTTWTTPVDLSVSSIHSSGDAVGVKSIVFPTIIAGDDDRAAFAFLGTTTVGAGAVPYTDGFTGVWHLYVAFTYDGGSTWTSVDVTPTDPVQRGCISLGGTLGAACAHRNLLDFMDIVTDAQGHVLVGYADGCISTCAGASGTNAQSTSALATIARQTGGQCLFAGACGSASGTTFTPVLPGLPKVDQCDSKTVIFSRNSAGTPSLNSHAVVCTVEAFNGGSGPVDTAFINPGSDRVSVRYTVDLGAGASAYAIVNGLGLTNFNATLTRTAATTGGFTWDSALMPIVASASGPITAVVWDATANVAIDTVTFHTVA